MTALRAAFRFELAQTRRDPGQVMPVLTAPLYTLMFLAIAQQAGRADLTNYAVLAPALIVLWGTALFNAGEIIDSERWAGTLEAVVATPAPLGVIMLGRVLGVVTLARSGSSSRGRRPRSCSGCRAHPAPGLVPRDARCDAVRHGRDRHDHGVGVRAGSVRAHVPGSLSCPLYVLGGVLVPVALLPGWVQPASWLVFLSWSADLLRDTLEVAPIASPLPRLAMVVMLGVAGFAVGHWMLRRILARVRVTATLADA